MANTQLDEQTKKSVFDSLDSLISQSDISDVTSESTEKRGRMKDGIYLCELKSATLGQSKSSGNPMVTLEFSTIDDGITTTYDSFGNASKQIIKGSKGKRIMKFCTFNPDRPSDFSRFVSDMLKFEDAPKHSALSKEMFVSAEKISQCLEIVIGMNVYVQLSSTRNKGVSSDEPLTEDNSTQWTTLISFERAVKLGIAQE